MLFATSSEISLLRHLCNNPFTSFSISEISKSICISNVWGYMITRNLKALLKEENKTLKLDFSLLLCKRLKLLFDAEYIESLDDDFKRNIFKISDKIAYEMSPCSIILVGSVASGKHNKESDIDFLVISEKKDAPYFENYNLVSLTKGEFKDKYLKGDDFVISALLFGKVLLDDSFFINFFESPLPIFSKEVIQEKIKFCENLEERVYALLKINDERANEELLYLALQSARIILLKNRIVPRTKSEIASQVRPFNKRLSEVIQKVQKSKIGKNDALSYINVCMDNVR